VDDPPSTTEFLELWPTLLMRDRLPGCEDANRALESEILRIDSEHSDLTTDYLSGNLLIQEHPAISWLRECINQATIVYIRRLGIDYQLDWQLQGWANVNRFGDYHNLHNHPHAWLSGTYYVAVPDSSEPLAGRQDRNPGAISFYDPRAQANMGAIRGDGQVEAEHRILPEAGCLLVWPAFLHHMVHPNLSREARISVSFNVVLRWSEKYLPKQ